MPEIRSVDPSRAVRKFASHAEQEQEDRRYWLSKSIAEKMEETAELVRYAYWLRGIDVDAQGSDRTIVRVERQRG
jgi:hypothetical protein